MRLFGRKEAAEAIIVGAALSFVGAAATYVFDRLRDKRKREDEQKPKRQKKRTR